MSSEYQELLEKLLNSDTTDVIPQSRAEHIMLTAINSLNIDTLPEPGSRMEAYLMALITKMGEGGSASQTQSDWNQNDSTQPDYVKNKTHYSKLKFVSQARKIPNESYQEFNGNFNIASFDAICIEINETLFTDLYGDTLMGDSDPSVWESGDGMGFYIVRISNRYNIYIDTNRYGPVKDATIKLYNQTVEKVLPHYYLPTPTMNTLGGVKVFQNDDVLGYTQCCIDGDSVLYSKEYKAANIYTELSITNLKALSYFGDHALFTDNIAKEFQGYELTLPIHAWFIGMDYSFSPYRNKYILESADGTTMLVNIANSEIKSTSVLHAPSSGGSLIVTFNPGDPTKTTHSSSEIYEAFQSGKTVQFYDGRQLYPLVASNVDLAIFASGGLVDVVSFETIIITDNSEIITIGPAFVPTLTAAAEVGQTMVVKSVDENGHPTEWEAVGMEGAPTVTTANNGQFLRVVNGSWAASTVPNAEEASF